jgi:hypothetical protein
MSRKASAYNQILNVLHELHKSYPNFNMGRHLSTALDGYGDLWGVSDSEVAFALNRYKTQLDNDGYSATDENIDKIIQDGINLDGLFKEEEEDNGYN